MIQAHMAGSGSFGLTRCSSQRKSCHCTDTPDCCFAAALDPLARRTAWKGKGEGRQNKRTETEMCL